MTISAICSREVITVYRDATVLHAAMLMRQYHVGDVVVIEDRKGKSVPVGIITDRDIVIELVATELDCRVITVGDIMLAHLTVVKEDTGISNAIQLMSAKGIRRLPVVDSDGGLLGIVTLDDVLLLLAKEFGALAKLVMHEQKMNWLLGVKKPNEYTVNKQKEKNMTINQTAEKFKSTNHDRPLLEQDIDAYQAKEKLPEPTACPQCGAVFHQGHWQWGTAPSDANRDVCPACHRMNDHCPAGFVKLEGEFLKAHSEDILHLMRNHEHHQRTEHPLKRIISIEKIEDKEDALLVTTTDIHLARGLGEALHHAYQGELSIKYNAGEHLLRVHWSR